LSEWGVMPAMCTDREAMSTERNHQGLSHQLLRSDPIASCHLSRCNSASASVECSATTIAPPVVRTYPVLRPTHLS
jgi:hypothetical protein